MAKLIGKKWLQFKSSTKRLITYPIKGLVFIDNGNVEVKKKYIISEATASTNEYWIIDKEEYDAIMKILEEME